MKNDTRIAVKNTIEGEVHQDGDGFNIQLTAIPLAGRLVVRKPKSKADEGEVGQ